LAWNVSCSLCKGGVIATLPHCSLSEAFVLEKQLALGERDSRLSLAPVTPNKPALLLGSLPSGLASEELPAAQSVLEPLHLRG
jgi:hypothetical protein